MTPRFLPCGQLKIEAQVSLAFQDQDNARQLKRDDDVNMSESSTTHHF